MKLNVLALACALSLASLGFAQGETQTSGDKLPASATKTVPLPKGGDGFDTGVTIAKNPLKCAIPDNLIFETSSGFPRTEFFSCDPEKVPVEISAIVDYGRKSNISLERYGFAPSKAEAEQLQRLFPKERFLSPEDKTSRQYLGVLKEGLRKKGVSYTYPAKK